MGRSRVVRPEVTTIQLSDGDWIRIKRQLNWGEQRQLYARSRVPTGVDGAAVYDRLEAGLAIVLAHMLDWSLGDAEPTLAIAGRSEAEVRSAYESLDEASAIEILRAIETHRAAITAERTAEKNGPAGETASGPISPSPSAVDGGSSGSAS